MLLSHYVHGVLQMLCSNRAFQRRTCCTAVAKYRRGIVTSDEEVEENKAVFVHDDILEDNAEEIAIDLARLAWETKVEDISVVDVAAQTSVCRCASYHRRMISSKQWCLHVVAALSLIHI